MTDFRAIHRATNAAHVASRFREYRRVMIHWSEVLPVAVHHVEAHPGFQGGGSSDVISGVSSAHETDRSD